MVCSALNDGFSSNMTPAKLSRMVAAMPQSKRVLLRHQAAPNIIAASQIDEV